VKYDLYLVQCLKYLQSTVKTGSVCAGDESIWEKGILGKCGE